jgi:TonB-like protein
MKRWSCPIALSFLYANLVCASDAVNQQEAIARLQQAVSKTNVFELPSFAMNANLHIESHGRTMEGTYQLLWNGPDQWREAISLPGYSEVQIGGKRMIWVQRTADFIPFPVYNIRQALGFGSNASSPKSTLLIQSSLTSRDAIKKTVGRKEHGDKLICYQIEDDQKHSSEICVHESTGTIARLASYYADTDLQPVGGKVFPRHLSVHLENRTAAQVNVTDFSTPAQFPAGTFLAPAGVQPQIGCMNPTLPRLVKRQQPEYPPAARQQHREGTVAFDALIALDGAPQLRKLIETAGSDFEDSSRRALSQWRYEPALCNGQPVEVETVLQVNYTLSP